MMNKTMPAKCNEINFYTLECDGMGDNIKWINNKTVEMLRAFELYEVR